MVTYPTTPVLIDLFLTEFNAKIVTLLPWLDNPLGQIQEISRHLDSRYVKVPAMHTDSGEYIDVLPDDKLTNYSWWQFSPIELSGKNRAKVKVPAKLNMFLNLKQIYPTELNARKAQNVIYEIEQIINKINLKYSALRITKISTDKNTTYHGFNIDQVDDKYFMHPYLTISISLDVYIKQNYCVNTGLRYSDVLDNTSIYNNNINVLAYGL